MAGICSFAFSQVRRVGYIGKEFFSISSVCISGEVTGLFCCISGWLFSGQEGGPNDAFLNANLPGISILDFRGQINR